MSSYTNNYPIPVIVRYKVSNHVYFPTALAKDPHGIYKFNDEVQVSPGQTVQLDPLIDWMEVVDTNGNPV